MNNFSQRVITGILFILILVGAIIYSSLTFQLLFLWIALLSLREFYNLIKSTGSSPNSTLGLIIGCACYLILTGIASGILSNHFAWIIIPTASTIFVAELYRKKQNPFLNIAYTLTGIIYVIIPFAMLHYISMVNGSYQYQNVLGFFILLWTSDSMAYVFGKWLGKHRLFERISPKKSWEGSVGGLISSVAVAYLLSRYFIQLTSLEWMVIAMIVVIAGTFGDLTESMLKRSINVKDSGTLLPGHGGLLDRFDGLFISVPFVLMYLMLR